MEVIMCVVEDNFRALEISKLSAFEKGVTPL